MNALNLEVRQQSLRTAHLDIISRQPECTLASAAEHLACTPLELVAAGDGSSIALAAPLPAIFEALPSLGQVVAHTANDACRHSRAGRYEDVQAKAPVGLVLGSTIDLRMFFREWQHAYAIDQGTERQLYFFAADGSLIHRVELTAQSNTSAWATLLERHRTAVTWPQLRPYPEDNTPTEVADPTAFRQAWLALRDTHDFFPLLQRFKVRRLGALKAAGDDLAQPVAADAVATTLAVAAASALPIMCFVGNRGIVQIYSGPIRALERQDGHLRIADPDFRLELDTTRIGSAWVVNKPTTDGWVTSLEVYDVAGELIVQLFGVRKPGQPELPAWRALMNRLCATPLAS